MSAQKPEWFEYTEGNTPASGLRKVDKKLPIGILALVGVLLILGSIFTNANQESSANASTPSITQSVAPTNTTLEPAPQISPVQSVQSRGGDDHDGREHQGRDGDWREGHERGDD